MRRSSVRTWIPLLYVPLILGQGCPETSSPPGSENKTGNGAQHKSPGFLGTWKYVSGPLLADISPDFQPTGLVLNADGTGKLHQTEDASGTSVCINLTYTHTDTHIQMNLHLRDSRGAVLRSFTFDRADDNLALSSGAATSSFTRDAADADAASCGTVRIVSRTPLAVGPHPNTGLVYDGTSLWFRGAAGDNLYPVNPDTATLGTPLELSPQSNNIHAAQGGGFWTFCWCNGNTEARHRTRAGAHVTTIDTNALGQLMSIFAMAREPGGNVLWLSGRSVTDNVNRLLRVNTNALPPQLLNAGVFNVPLLSMSFSGTSLWALTQFQSIVQIDTNTLRAVVSFDTPDPTVAWQGIAAVGTRLFLIGRTSNNQGVLIEVAP